MPIVVDEVVISVEVTNQSGSKPGAKPVDNDGKQEIINQCVERVLEILELEKER